MVILKKKQNKTILFLCTGNSCRSQMAEGFGEKYLKEYNISSAGTEPEKVNPNAIETMNKVGIDISFNKSDKVDVNSLSDFSYIITLCGDARDKCINISEYADKHIHWDIYDPAKYDGTEECENRYSEVRDMIYSKIKKFSIGLN